MHESTNQNGPLEKEEVSLWQSVFIRVFKFVFACLVLVTLFSWSVEIIMRSDVLSAWCFDAFAITQKLPTALEDHASVYAYYFQNGSLASPPWTERELIHFADVRQVFTTFRYLAWIGTLAIVIILIFNRNFLQIMRSLPKPLMVAVAYMVMLSLPWHVFTQAIHPLVFAGNWSFTPGHHRIIELYPQSYLATHAAAMLSLFFVLSLGMSLLSSFLHIPEEKPQEENDKFMKQDINWWYLIPVLIFILPFYWAGTAMVFLFDWAFWTYYVVIFILALCVFLFLWHKGFWTRILCGLSILYYVALIAGAYTAVYQGHRSVDEGQSAVLALFAYQEAKHDLPPSIPDHFKNGTAEAQHQQEVDIRQLFLQLNEFGLDVVPECRAGSGCWYYVRESRHHFRFGFRGPLKYSYEFSSRRGTWNVPYPNWLSADIAAE